MKMCEWLVLSLAVGWAGVASGAASGVATADQLVNDFGDGVQSWSFDFGGSGSTLSQDPLAGSPGNALGALRLDMPFPANEFAFTGDLYFPAANLSVFANIEFDLMIGTGSAFDAFGNHGFMNFVSREADNYNWNPLLSDNLAPAVGWQTFSLPASSLTATRAFSLQLFGGGSQNINGNVTLFLDNLRLTVLVPEPSTALLVLLMGCCFPLYRLR